MMGEPILDKPESYVSIKRKENHSIEEKRQWVFLGCDGAPYCLANRIIDESDSEYESLIPGLGHLHMNEIKTFLKVLDSRKHTILQMLKIHTNPSRQYKSCYMVLQMN